MSHEEERYVFTVLVVVSCNRFVPVLWAFEGLDSGRSRFRGPLVSLLLRGCGEWCFGTSKYKS